MQGEHLLPGLGNGLDPVLFLEGSRQENHATPWVDQFEGSIRGGFLLTEENDALAEHFAVGEELVTYRTLDELRRKALYYLNNPDKARSIAKRGHERVLQDHTIAQRVDTMLEEMALS